MSDVPCTADPVVFPLEWNGRIIARGDADNLCRDLVSVLRGLGYDAVPQAANASSKGTYVSYGVTLTIPDRDALNRVSYALSRVEGVRMVL